MANKKSERRNAAPPVAIASNASTSAGASRVASSSSGTGTSTGANTSTMSRKQESTGPDLEGIREKLGISTHMVMYSSTDMQLTFVEALYDSILYELALKKGLHIKHRNVAVRYAQIQMAFAYALAPLIGWRDDLYWAILRSQMHSSPAAVAAFAKATTALRVKGLYPYNRRAYVKDQLTDLGYEHENADFYVVVDSLVEQSVYVMSEGEEDVHTLSPDQHLGYFVLPSLSRSHQQIFQRRYIAMVPREFHDPIAVILCALRRLWGSSGSGSSTNSNHASSSSSSSRSDSVRLIKRDRFGIYEYSADATQKYAAKHKIKPAPSSLPANPPSGNQGNTGAPKGSTNTSTKDSKEKNGSSSSTTAASKDKNSGSASTQSTMKEKKDSAPETTAAKKSDQPSQSVSLTSSSSNSATRTAPAATPALGPKNDSQPSTPAPKMSIGSQVKEKPNDSQSIAVALKETGDVKEAALIDLTTTTTSETTVSKPLIDSHPITAPTSNDANKHQEPKAHHSLDTEYLRFLLSGDNASDPPTASSSTKKSDSAPAVPASKQTKGPQSMASLPKQLDSISPSSSAAKQASSSKPGTLASEQASGITPKVSASKLTNSSQSVAPPSKESSDAQSSKPISGISHVSRSSAASVNLTNVASSPQSTPKLISSTSLPIMVATKSTTLAPPLATLIHAQSQQSLTSIANGTSQLPKAKIGPKDDVGSLAPEQASKGKSDTQQSSTLENKVMSEIETLAALISESNTKKRVDDSTSAATVPVNGNRESKKSDVTAVTSTSTTATTTNKSSAFESHSTTKKPANDSKSVTTTPVTTPSVSGSRGSVSQTTVPTATATAATTVAAAATATAAKAATATNKSNALESHPTTIERASDSKPAAGRPMNGNLGSMPHATTAPKVSPANMAPTLTSATTPSGAGQASQKAVPGMNKAKEGASPDSATPFYCDANLADYAGPNPNLELYKPQLKGLSLHQFFKTLSHQIEMVYEGVLPDAATVANHTELLSLLQATLKELHPGPQSNVLSFGSFCNGLLMNDSDADFCIAGDPRESDPVLADMTILALYLEDMGMEEIQVVDQATVPIVKFVDPHTKLKGDINYGNRLGVVNSDMIRMYTEIDVRCKQLLYLVKLLCRRQGINNSSKGTLSSYALNMMGITFLQNQNPPVLPRLQSQTGFLSTSKSVDYYQRGRDGRMIWRTIVCTYDTDLERYRDFGKANGKSIGRLLFEFFEFYSRYYDYTGWEVSPALGAFAVQQYRGPHMHNMMSQSPSMSNSTTTTLAGGSERSMNTTPDNTSNTTASYNYSHGYNFTPRPGTFRVLDPFLPQRNLVGTCRGDNIELVWRTFDRIYKALSEGDLYKVL
ncbi:hypothetical protein BGW42_003453 [Actinomortierella wolfii]|nr:hypothetical protein BGW42_003453 [Actinomortierella wolfii]